MEVDERLLFMKLALISDTHWGVRNDNAAFLDNSKHFLDDVFFPVLQSQGISTVVHLGDLVDRRKYINIQTAKRLREDFLEPISQMGVELHMIAGNHDTYYKNTNSVNALQELLGSRYINATIYTDATTVMFDDTPILFIPWITDENRESTLYNIECTDAQIAMGHLELQGFEMHRGSIVSHGDDPKVFDKFDVVCSGHYHHRSSSGNIHYLGSHAEFTWSDYDDPRGFHIFDTDTRELTFIENPYKMFKKVWYNDAEKNISEILSQDFGQYRGKILKVIVTCKSNPYWFDMFIENIEKVGVIDMQIVDDHLNLAIEEDSDIVNEAESTLEIFRKYIGQFNLPDKNRIKLENTITELYNEALAVE